MNIMRLPLVVVGLIFVLYFSSAQEEPTLSPKKGLVIPYWPQHRCGDFEAFSTVSWYYNYHTVKDPKTLGADYKPNWCWCVDDPWIPPSNRSLCLPSNPEVKHIPMIYSLPGYGSRDHEEFYQNPPLEDWIYQFLTYNEPNVAEQSNIPPEVAAEDYRKLQDQYPDKVMIGPGVGHLDTEWMDEFMTVCDALNCRMDYVAGHLYKPAQSGTKPGTVDERMAQLEAYSERYGKKIWFTEFAMAMETNETKIVEFVEEFLPRLEHASFIARYSWFVTRYYENEACPDPNNQYFCLDTKNSLLKQDAPELTAVGEAYDKPWHLEKYNPYK